MRSTTARRRSFRHKDRGRIRYCRLLLICTATSNTHVRALAEAVEEKLDKAGVKPDHTEGRSSDWLLLDYGTVVVHIFGRKSRDYYSLDRMWSDGETVDLEGVLEKGTEE